MPHFSVHLSQGKFSNVVDVVFENDECARQGAMTICADLGRDIFAGLQPGSEWANGCLKRNWQGYLRGQDLLAGFGIGRVGRRPSSCKAKSSDVGCVGSGVHSIADISQCL